MKKILTLILCILYTFVTFGGSVFVHHCGEDSQLSIYEKHSHDTCPICASSDQVKSNECKEGSCQDIEVKIDQLSDELFSAKKNENFNIQPIILQRLWMEMFNFSPDLPQLNLLGFSYYKISYNSPPDYIIHCNFRN